MFVTLIKHAQNAFFGLLDLIYPPYCLVCGNAKPDYLCEDCINQIDIIEPPYCHKCGLPCESYLCTGCREREFAFEAAYSAAVFDGALRKAIHLLKYRKHEVMAESLADLMTQCFPNAHFAGKADIVIPVPIHRRRKLERGFNQSEELARMFCNHTNLPFQPGSLIKIKNTKHQVDLPHDERAINIKGAFKVPEPTAIAGKRVLLIDDVFTTGSTLDEAALTLKSAGAQIVYGYTLARSL